MPNQNKPSFFTRIRWYFSGRGSTGEKGISIGSQLLSQLFLLLVAATVLYPILWVVSMSFDPRDISRPTELRLNPFQGGLTLKAYQDVIKQPTANPVSLGQLMFNSFVGFVWLPSQASLRSL
ncbi:MAG: hypothetical protein M1485_03715 [Chloroflexi bacterium]|nr:hypothetical protein [Chloroflexota bacterium]